MAAISADLNALASVLTRDFYFRIINPGSSERALVRVGRLFTLALGIVVIGLSLWIAVTHQESLFHAMVTVFGLFLAPTMLPILAGLTVRWLTWKGALCGFVSGLVTGVLMLCLKTWYLPSIPGISAQFVSYTFEAISIFFNIGMTALGLWLGSVIPAREPAEEARIAAFFQALDMPVTRSEAGDVAGASNRPVLAAATIVVGGLLIVAGIVAGPSQARWFDLSVGGALAALGARLAFARSKTQRSKTQKKQYSTTV
jgi:solute:Na+ symporter, SSS family